MRRRWPVVAAFVCAALVAGCGDDAGRADGGAADEPGKSAPAAKPVGTESAGSVVQFADCDDWRAGTVAERRATVDALRGQLTPQSSATAESPLGDERAFEILEKACVPDYAGSLRLYKLYVRAQAFAPLSE